MQRYLWFCCYTFYLSAAAKTFCLPFILHLEDSDRVDCTYIESLHLFQPQVARWPEFTGVLDCAPKFPDKQISYNNGTISYVMQELLQSYLPFSLTRWRASRSLQEIMSLVAIQVQVIKMSQCNHEANYCSCARLNLYHQTVDTDVIVLLVGHFHSLHKYFFATTLSVQIIWAWKKAGALPPFHALTGVWHNILRSKKSAWLN